jgi:hypothetical protein
MSPCKNIIFKKSSKKKSKSFKILELYNKISSFNTSQNISSFRNPQIKIDLLLLPRGQNPLKLVYSIMNLNTISLPGKARPKIGQYKMMDYLVQCHHLDQSL